MLEIETKTCACGCGGKVSKYAKFVSGHNAKNKITKLCECGCGKPVARNRNKYATKECYGNAQRFEKPEAKNCLCGCGNLATPGSDYIRGHNYSHGATGEHRPKEEKVSNICACGCNGETKPGNKFITGHNNRKNPIPVAPLCKCGCGRETKKIRQRYNTYATQECMAKAYSKEKPAPKPCRCGCGEYAEPGNEFVWGHNVYVPELKEAMIAKCREAGRKLAENGMNPMQDPNNVAKWKKTVETSEAWQTMIANFVQTAHARPNKLERSVLDLSLDNLVYTGSGDYWITFSNGKRKNPDFIVEGTHKVIECADLKFWHTPEEMAGVIESYKELGIECLLVSYQDMKSSSEETLLKVCEFVNN